MDPIFTISAFSPISPDALAGSFIPEVNSTDEMFARVRLLIGQGYDVQIYWPPTTNAQDDAIADRLAELGARPTFPPPPLQRSFDLSSKR